MWILSIFQDSQNSEKLNKQIIHILKINFSTYVAKLQYYHHKRKFHNLFHFTKSYVQIK